MDKGQNHMHRAKQLATIAHNPHHTPNVNISLFSWKKNEYFSNTWCRGIV